IVATGSLTGGSFPPGRARVNERAGEGDGVSGWLPVVTSAPPTSEGRPAMEDIGNDVHQRESQVRLSGGEGGQVLLERRVRTRGRAVRGATGGAGPGATAPGRGRGPRRSGGEVDRRRTRLICVMRVWRWPGSAPSRDATTNPWPGSPRGP